MGPIFYLDHNVYTTLITNSVKVKMNVLGALQSNKIPKIRVNYGSGWVVLGLILNFCFVGKLSQIALNQYLYFGVVYHVYSVCI